MSSEAIQKLIDAQVSHEDEAMIHSAYPNLERFDDLPGLRDDLCALCTELEEYITDDRGPWHE